MIKMMIDEDGDKIWYDSSERDIEDVKQSGELCWHRLDGPAYESEGGSTWWLNNEPYTNFKDFQEDAKLTDDQITILKLKYGNEI
jgi:hypothetical protein